ncbi:hypothetical protein M8J77_013764 [Diaphorina citri]|nr:hypothetical protein M8J77_013764 [Diaphorina citri]
MFLKFWPWGRTRAKLDDVLTVPKEVINQYHQWKEDCQKILTDMKMGADQLAVVEKEARDIKEQLILMNQELNEIAKAIDEDTHGIVKAKLKTLQNELSKEKLHMQIAYYNTGLSTVNLLHKQKTLSEIVKKATEKLIISMSEQPYQRSSRNDREMAKLINTTRYVRGEIDQLNEYAEKVRHIVNVKFVERFVRKVNPDLEKKNEEPCKLQSAENVNDQKDLKNNDDSIALLETAEVAMKTLQSKDNVDDISRHPNFTELQDKIEESDVRSEAAFDDKLEEIRHESSEFPGFAEVFQKITFQNADADQCSIGGQTSSLFSSKDFL